MPRTRHSARWNVLRALASVACACALIALTSCGKDAKMTNPIVSQPGAPGPMITLRGDPRVSFNLQGYVDRVVGQDTLAGYYYVTLSDSLGRHLFVQDLTLNGVPMRPETSGGGTPNRYSLRPVDLGPGYHTADSLVVAITDTSGLTDPFAVTVVPSAFGLAPDGTVISQKNDLTVGWSGAAERVSLTLRDFFGTKITAGLQFENETGVSELLVRAQDLKVLSPGALSVGTSLTNSESIVTNRARRMTASVIVDESRVWQLAP
jgi:hypothetical protein